MVLTALHRQFSAAKPVLLIPYWILTTSPLQKDLSKKFVRRGGVRQLELCGPRRRSPISFQIKAFSAHAPAQQIPTSAHPTCTLLVHGDADGDTASCPESMLNPRVRCQARRSGPQLSLSSASQPSSTELRWTNTYRLSIAPSALAA